jgi:hypothetical protein
VNRCRWRRRLTSARQTSPIQPRRAAPGSQRQFIPARLIVRHALLTSASTMCCVKPFPEWFFSLFSLYPLKLSGVLVPTAFITWGDAGKRSHFLQRHTSLPQPPLLRHSCSRRVSNGAWLSPTMAPCWEERVLASAFTIWWQGLGAELITTFHVNSGDRALNSFTALDRRPERPLDGESRLAVQRLPSTEVVVLLQLAFASSLRLRKAAPSGPVSI